MRILSSFGLLVMATAVSTLTACGGSVESTGTGDARGAGSGSGSASQTGTGSESGSTTATSPEPYGSGCTYPKVYNDPECPPAYTRQPPPSCTSIGLKCFYPGVGDGDGHGCWSTALLACQANADVDGGADGGADGGTTGHWLGAQ